MKSSREIGGLIREARKSQGLTQSDLAMIANTAQRFISELERGKPTCQLGKTLDVLAALGIRIELRGPDTSGGGGNENTAGSFAERARRHSGADVNRAD